MNNFLFVLSADNVKLLTWDLVFILIYLHNSTFSSAVSNDALRGATPEAAAQVLQWVSFADSEIIPPASAWVFPTLGIMQFNKQVCSSAFSSLVKT